MYGDEGIRDVDHVVIFQYRNQTNGMMKQDGVVKVWLPRHIFLFSWLFHCLVKPVAYRSLQNPCNTDCINFHIWKLVCTCSS